MRPLLGLAVLLASGCSVLPPSVVRGPSVVAAPTAAPTAAPIAPPIVASIDVPVAPSTVVRERDFPRFQPDDPACGATACAYRVLVSQVWDLVRR